MMELSYRRHRFPSVVIQHAVWLYLRFTLSYGDVEDLLAERGLDISYETVRSWVLKFGPVIARRQSATTFTPRRGSCEAGWFNTQSSSPREGRGLVKGGPVLMEFRCGGSMRSIITLLGSIREHRERPLSHAA